MPLHVKLCKFSLEKKKISDVLHKHISSNIRLCGICSQTSSLGNLYEGWACTFFANNLLYFLSQTYTELIEAITYHELLILETLGEH